MQFENLMTNDQKVKLKALMIDQCVDKESVNDEDFFYDYLTKNHAWFKNLNDNRKISIVWLISKIGIKNFDNLQDLILCLHFFDYHLASKRILECDYAKHFKESAEKMAQILISGEL